MTIEFNCHICGKFLRTSDDKAGRTAKCPGCGERITVPHPEAPAEEEEYGGEEFEDYGAEDFGEAGQYEDYDEYGEYGAPAAPPRAGTAACPMCGEQVRRTATRCPYCGEDLAKTRRAARGGTIEVGEVLSTSWQIFTGEMGLAIGGTILVWVIGIAVNFGTQMCSGIVNAAVAAGGRPGPGAFAVVIFVMVVAMLIQLIVQWYLQLGLTQLMVNIARGRRPEISNLFNGGPYFLRMAGNSIVYGLMMLPLVAVAVLGAFGIVGNNQPALLVLGVAGIALAVVGVLILSLMFWPYVYVLVDQDPPGLESLWVSRRITSGNWLPVVGLWLLLMLINLVGLIPCFLGLIFTVPYSLLAVTVAYCRMAGRRTVRV